MLGSIANSVRSLRIEDCPCWKVLYCWTSSWIGAKKRFRYRKNATSAPMLSWWLSDHVAADRQQRRLRQVSEQLRARTVDRVDLGGVVVGVAVVADDVAVMDDVVSLAVVGGDGADAVQALGEVGEHVRDPVADAVVTALGRACGTTATPAVSAGTTSASVISASFDVEREQQRS